MYYGIRTNHVIFSHWAEIFFWAFQTSWTTKWPITYVFIDFFSFLGFSQFLRWNPDHFQIEIYGFYGMNGPFWDYFIKGCAVQKCVFFEISYFIILWDLVHFGGEVQTTSRSNFYGFYGVNGPFWDYFTKGCAVQKCVFLRYRTFLSFYWTLSIFRGEIETSSKSNFYSFYGVNGPF